MFSKFFIKRPIFATVMAIIMVGGGLMAVKTLPVAQFPDITPPTVMVSAEYPGADAKTIAQSVAVPIEQQVNGVDNMLYMSSDCSEGSYSLTITFRNGTDVDQAAVDVQNRISQADSQLPSEVKQQGIDVRKEQSNQVLFVALESDNPKQYDALYLTNYAQMKLTEPLSRVDGVGGVGAFGGGEYDMRVWLNPEKMRIRNVTPSEVNSAIQSQNVRASAGSVGEAPGAGNTQFSYTISASGTLSTPEEFGDIVIREDETGILRLKDVADVELGRSSYSEVARINGQETALLAVMQGPGANALEVADGSLAELDRLSQYFPDGVHYSVVMNATDYVRSSIKEVLHTFVVTTLIVMLVILLFLQSWRAVIIPMLTIPVSLIATFMVMKLMGFTLNTLTLFGLVLAIAIVVDDAIVVVEDCQRILDKGLMNRRQAAVQAMKELTGPVVGEVLVLMSVFIPTAFISGITGQLYKQFALTIAVSTAFSGFNALTLTPALCALFLKPSTNRPNIVYRLFNKGYGAVAAFYQKLLEKLLKHPYISFGSFAAVVIATIFIFVSYPSSYLPEEDEGYFFASVQLPPSASLERTEKVVNAISAEMRREIPYIKDVMTVSGAGMMGGGDGSNTGTIVVILKPWKDRGSKGSVENVIKMADEIAGRVQQEAVFFAANPPTIPGLGTSSGLSLQLLDINSLGSMELKKGIDALKDAAMKTGQFSDINSMYQAGVPQYEVVVNRDKAAMRHLDISEVYATLSAYMGGSYAGDFTDFDNLFEITIRADGRQRSQVDNLYNITFRNSEGEQVPFGAFADVKPIMGSSTLSRYNLYTTASLTAIPAHGVSTSTAIKTLERLCGEVLGKNFSYAWTGIAYQETNAHTTISFVFIFAIIMTILVLAAQYESWTSPIAVVLAMPVAVLGCLLGCFVMNQSVSIYTQIGLILLLGMAAKNAILIVEYAMDFRKSGIDIDKAAHDAGVIRFRPIMMTALAFIFGVLPMMLATGISAGSRQEIGTAIVFGMSVNAIVGPLMVPVFWKILQRFQEKYLSRLFALPTKPDANGASVAASSATATSGASDSEPAESVSSAALTAKVE